LSEGLGKVRISSVPPACEKRRESLLPAGQDKTPLLASLLFNLRNIFDRVRC